MPDNEQQSKKYILPNNGQGWETGNVITAARMNEMGNALKFTSEEIDNAINGTIYDHENNDILARKLDGLVKYFTSPVQENTNLEYTRFYAEKITDDDEKIIVPTLDEYNTFTENTNNNYNLFKQNFVQSYSKDKAYAKGDYIEYGEKIYKLLAPITANASANSSDAAWATIDDNDKQEINVMQELNGLIEEFSNLKSALFSEETIEITEINVTNGRYVGSDGVTHKSSLYGYTDPIPVQPGDIVTISGVKLTGSAMCVCAYKTTVTSSFVSPALANDTNNTTVTVTVPEEAYYLMATTAPDGVVSCTIIRRDAKFAKNQYNPSDADRYLVVQSDGEVGLGDNISGIVSGELSRYITPTVSSSGEGKYIRGLDGAVTEHASFNMTDPIGLPFGFTITVNAAGGSSANNVAIISKLSNGVYTPLVLNSAGTTPSTYTYTAQSAEQIVLSYLVSAGITVAVNGNFLNSIGLIKQKMDTENMAGTPLSMFTDIVCCGDSLTYSAVFTDSTHNRQAFVPWPKQIERVYGIPTTILADSGKNTKTWYADYGDTIAQSSGGNRLYITYFGHNASTQYPYTDTFDTDCPDGADPSTWADTLTGWWGRIINDIYAAGCKALIIRVSDSNGYRATQDAIIEDIAARWNVPVIDNPYLPDLMYHSATGSYANEAHYNDLGYMAFCRQLMTNINKMSATDLEHLLPSND